MLKLNHSVVTSLTVDGDNAELEDPSASEDVSGNKSDAAQDQKQP